MPPSAAMVGLLIAIRNFTIAIILAWLGFCVSPDSDEKQDSSSALPGSAISAIIG